MKYLFLLTILLPLGCASPTAIERKQHNSVDCIKQLMREGATADEAARACASIYKITARTLEKR